MKYFSMFSGIGGFELGIQRTINKQLAKIEQDRERRDGTLDKMEHYVLSSTKPALCVGHSEINTYAESIYQKHFGGKNYGDATKINTDELPDFDMLCGGFPCQAFSIAGKRKGFDDTRGTLFFEIARIAKAKQPRFLFLENVKGLLNHDKGETFTTILKTLDELGYDVQWQVLNSKHFGVPQNRERVFIIGHLRGTTRPEVFPIGKESTENLGRIGNEVSFCLDSNYYKGTNTIKKGRRQIIRCPLKFMNRNQKNIEGDYTYTIDSLNTGGIKENGQIRRLTPTECERLQGFPDGWTEGLSDTQRYKCLGNAVTVNVIEAVFSKLISYNKII